MTVLHFKKAWLFTPEQSRLIESKIIGDSINVCSGQSDLGTYKMDIEQKADIKADCISPPLRKFSIDTVIFDPPFSLYWMNKLINATHYLAQVAKKRMIVVGQWSLFDFKGFDKPEISIIVTRQNRLTPVCIYDRINQSLTTFEKKSQ